MDKQYFEEYYYLERHHWWFKARMKFIKIHLDDVVKKLPSGEPKILNVGAGTGYTTEVLSNYGTTTSVEYDNGCCRLVEEKLGIKFDHESITALPYPDNSFDLVTAFDVIEHVEDHQKAVSELIRVTKKGGVILTTVPAFMMLWSQHDVVNQHVRRYTLENYSELWNSHKSHLILIYKTYFNFHLFPFIFTFRMLTRVLPKNAFRKGAGSDFTIYKSNLIDNVLFKIMAGEAVYIRNKKSLPFGLSILMSFQKN